MQVAAQCYSKTDLLFTCMFFYSTETYMVVQTQHAHSMSHYCQHFECTPLGCEPWPPEDLGKQCLQLNNIITDMQCSPSILM